MSRPVIGVRAQHDSRPGEIYATYLEQGAWQVVWRYLDVVVSQDEYEIGLTHFVAPWLDCRLSPAGC